MNMTMGKVTSKDGTTIAFERAGEGAPLILVDGAMCSRAFGPMPKLAPLLARHFTVYWYDRRGRGDSGDHASHDVQREVEDLDALIREAGGSACVAGLSSGAVLALEAAAAGLPIRRLAVYEPPYVGGDHRGAHHREALEALVAQDRRADAVKYFMRDMVGAPAFVVVMMRCMPWIFRKLKAVAHTLPYDAALLGDFTVPARFAMIATPTLAIAGEKSPRPLRDAVAKVAATLPNADHLTLRGQTHNVKAAVLTPALVEFFAPPQFART
jgi:pimeloyl-ACP methyl ester carboxylesterase